MCNAELCLRSSTKNLMVPYQSELLGTSDLLWDMSSFVTFCKNLTYPSIDHQYLTFSTYTNPLFKTDSVSLIKKCVGGGDLRSVSKPILLLKHIRTWQIHTFYSLALFPLMTLNPQTHIQEHNYLLICCCKSGLQIISYERVLWFDFEHWFLCRWFYLTLWSDYLILHFEVVNWQLYLSHSWNMD